MVGSFCAYALARLRFRGKFIILALVLMYARAVGTEKLTG